MTEAIRQGDIPGVQLRRRQSLAVPPEEAWRWLTEPDRLALWLAERAEGTAEEVRLSGPDGEERARILETVPPKLRILAFEKLGAGWPAATRLILRVHPAGPGCEVDVLQDGFQRLPLSVCLTVWEAYRRRWRDALARLADVAVPTV
jgi:uncharacterized protein YndB with AHSA1/START domain